MASVAPSPRRDDGAHAIRAWLSRDSSRAALLLLGLAIASRFQFLGNPILDSDEGFYLLVGDRMLHGALPYVDIWDRKPVGLFLLYAAMRSLGGDGVLAYQLVGTGFAFATSCLIAGIARRFTGLFGATASGAAYLIWLTLGSASGGQAELFYALPVCAAAAITLRGFQRRGAGVLGGGLAAMLLVGAAAQIKYNALFEGMFFGCCWLAIAYRSGRRATLPAYALAWIAAAVAPTGLALAYYAARGQIEPFLFANFLSIWHRDAGAQAAVLGRLGMIVAILAPLLACVRPMHDPGSPPAATAYRFVLGWLAASIAAVLLFGTYLEQYLLPVVVPASAAAGAFFGRGGRMRVLVILALAFAAGQIKLAVTQTAHGSRDELDQIVRQIDHRHCLFVYSGLSALYRIGDTCIPTRFAFPSHLSRLREAHAIGVDPVREIDRVMRTRPGTVIVRSPYGGDENWAARRMVLGHLAQDYRRVFHGKLGWQWVDVYRPTGD